MLLLYIDSLTSEMHNLWVPLNEWFSYIRNSNVSRGSSGSIVSDYGLDDRVVEVQCVDEIYDRWFLTLTLTISIICDL
jgi:hypothetical protein